MNSLITITWPDSSFYHGEGNSSCPNGFGLYTNEYGVPFEGIWINGFSFGLFRSWLGEYLGRKNFYETYIERQTEEINFFIENDLRKNRYSVDELIRTFLMARRIKSSNEQLISIFNQYLREEVVIDSDNRKYGCRNFSCGGKFNNVSLLKKKIIQISKSISPYCDLIKCVGEFNDQVEDFMRYLYNELPGSIHWDEKEKKIISEFIRNN